MLAMVVLPASTLAQHAHGVPLEQLEAYAQAWEAIGKLRDQYQAEAAEPRNKKEEAIVQLQEKLRADVAAVLLENGLTQQQYDQITFAVSTDTATRQALDKILGIEPPEPLPAAAAAAPAAAANNPHIGHVTTSFNGTPGSQGLLPTALAEAEVVIQHAQLAARTPDNLQAMKTHAEHVIHAADPPEDMRGPGAGYGLKKAATGIATHIELAARADGAGQNVTTHAVHIATAARNTAERADRIVALARQVMEATDAATAASLVAEMNEVAAQLLPGLDANGDGRIGWQEGEGGLTHVEQHIALMNG